MAMFDSDMFGAGDVFTPPRYTDAGFDLSPPPPVSAGNVLKVPPAPPMAYNPGTGAAEHFDPRRWWETSDPNDRSWRYLTDDLKIFYNDNKQAAWGQYLDDQAGTNQTPLRAYLNQNFDRAVREYYRANEANPQLMFTDTLDANLINGLRQSFYMQPASARGVVLQWMPAGRYTG